MDGGAAGRRIGLGQALDGRTAELLRRVESLPRTRLSTFSGAVAAQNFATPLPSLALSAQVRLRFLKILPE
jgi:hypothetical protein